MDKKSFNCIFHKQNNSINGNFIYKKKRFFFKVIYKDDYFAELEGYQRSINKIPIKKMVYNNILSNNQYILIYEYDNTVDKNKGLLNDLFVSYDNSHDISYFLKKYIGNILVIYDISLRSTKTLKSSLNNRFFKNRIKSRLIPWYSKDKNFKKKIIINGRKSESISNIIKEVIEYFKNEPAQKCFFCQGDPNTLNISLEPCFFDLVTAGYNSIIGEFAIMMISTLLYDNYFCPKYHPQSYFLHEKAIEQYKVFQPFIEVSNNDILKIYCKFKSSKIRKEYVYQYIQILKNNNIFIDEKIKYYIIMRLLCVFNIENMESIDYYYSIYLVSYIYGVFKDKSKNVLPIIEKMLLEMEVI